MRRAVPLDPQHHVALDLVVEFLERVDVIVGAQVRPADDGDHVIVALDYGVAASGRPQQVRILCDPAVQGKGFDGDGIGHVSYSAAAGR